MGKAPQFTGEQKELPGLQQSATAIKMGSSIVRETQMHVTLGAAASVVLILSHLSYGQLEDFGQVFIYLRLLSRPPLN